MTRTISQRDLRNDSAAVLRQVEAGETLVITRNGTPVAELRPLGLSRYVPRDRLVAAGKTAPRIDFGRFRADLDGLVDPTLDD